MVAKIFCPMCASNNYSLKYEDYTGYISPLSYDIYECKECKTHFIDVSDIDLSIYDKIYSNVNTPGYDRYYQYALNIKNQKNPLQYLAYKEETYYPLFTYLKDKKNLDILEIGSGYGYTSHAMMQENNVTGIDISNKAVDFANENFGNHFYCSKIEDFKSDKKFDLIVATEIFEHLVDPSVIFDLSKKLLKKTGVLFVTTPNKDHSDSINKGAIWQTDLPPVHTFWGTKKGVVALANKHNFSVDFFDFKNYFDTNYWMEYKELLNEKVPQKSSICLTGNLVKTTINDGAISTKPDNYIKHWIKTKILYLKLFKYICMLYVKYSLKIKENRTMAMFFSFKKLS
jgi:SAM-dependent methyltransferase